MKNYIGTKQIKAKPMNRKEYNDFRGWILPDDEDGDDEGYLVEYPDGGKANTSKYEGYISWSPKEVFEKSYRENDTAKQRVRIEFDEIETGHNKLAAYIEKNGVNDPLLLKQRDIMNTYVGILEQRLNVWEDA